MRYRTKLYGDDDDGGGDSNNIVLCEDINQFILLRIAEQNKKKYDNE